MHLPFVNSFANVGQPCCKSKMNVTCRGDCKKKTNNKTFERCNCLSGCQWLIIVEFLYVSSRHGTADLPREATRWRCGNYFRWKALYLSLHVYFCRWREIRGRQFSSYKYGNQRHHVPRSVVCPPTKALMKQLALRLIGLMQEHLRDSRVEPECPVRFHMKNLGTSVVWWGQVTNTLA